MASKYYTEFSERKQTAGKPPANAKAGGTKAMPQKQSYTKGKLPGKASTAFKGWGSGPKKSGNAFDQGL